MYIFDAVGSELHIKKWISHMKMKQVAPYISQAPTYRCIYSYPPSDAYMRVSIGSGKGLSLVGAEVNQCRCIVDWWNTSPSAGSEFIDLHVRIAA